MLANEGIEELRSGGVEREADLVGLGRVALGVEGDTLDLAVQGREDGVIVERGGGKLEEREGTAAGLGAAQEALDGA